MSLEDTPRYITEQDTELEKVLDQFYKAYVKLKRVYTNKYNKDYDIRVVINGENNITIVTDNGVEQNYTYCYRED